MSGDTSEEGDEQESEALRYSDNSIERIRLPLPAYLGLLLGIRRYELIVETAISQKIQRDHPGDWPFLERIELLVTSWQFARVSPKGVNRVEIYGQLDEIWFTAVLRANPTAECAVLITLHRIYRRKVESRIRRGYLEIRED